MLIYEILIKLCAELHADMLCIWYIVQRKLPRRWPQQVDETYSELCFLQYSKFTYLCMHGPGVDTASNRNEYQGISWG